MREQALNQRSTENWKMIPYSECQNGVEERMQQSDALKGELHLRWYEDGRFEFHLPADGMIAYAMLHAAEDEIHERMMARKAEHKKAQRLVTVPKDGSLQQPEWGR